MASRGSRRSRAGTLHCEWGSPHLLQAKMNIKGIHSPFHPAPRRASPSISLPARVSPPSRSQLSSSAPQAPPGYSSEPLHSPSLPFPPGTPLLVQLGAVRLGSHYPLSVPLAHIFLFSISPPLPLFPIPARTPFLPYTPVLFVPAVCPSASPPPAPSRPSPSPPVAVSQRLLSPRSRDSEEHGREGE